MSFTNPFLIDTNGDGALLSLNHAYRERFPDLPPPLHLGSGDEAAAALSEAALHALRDGGMELHRGKLVPCFEVPARVDDILAAIARACWPVEAPSEYGFYANVNPQVDHPRWSQATERRLGEDGIFAKKRPTLMFNGYESQVGQLYAGMDLKKFY